MTEAGGNGGYYGYEVPTEELRIWDLEETKAKTAKEIVDKMAIENIPALNKDFVEGRRTMMINGEEAEIYSDTGEGSRGEDILLLKNGSVITMHVIGMNSPTMQKIISTFKFQ